MAAAPFRHLLLATSGAAHATKVTQTAIDVAKHCGAKASVVYVVIPPELQLADAKGLKAELKGVERALEHQAAEVLKTVRARFTAAEVPILGAQIRHGHPAEEITGEAIEVGADLIVIGARGLGGTLGGVLGTITDKVIQLAACPVLVVR